MTLKLKSNPSLWHQFHEEFFDNFTSVHTRLNYRSDLEQFWIFLSEHYPQITGLEEITPAVVVHYRNQLQECFGLQGQVMAPKSLARKLSALASYFDFLVAEVGAITHNPVHSVKRPRLEVVRPTMALSQDQVRELFSVINQETSCGPLHLALIVTLFTSGLRKSEVIQLKRKDYRDINDQKVLEYRGKGGKIRQKLVHIKAREVIDHYLSWMAAQGREHHEEDWLFQPSQNRHDAQNLNKPLNPRTVSRILQSYARRIGLNFRVSPHSARATFITVLLEQGVSLLDVSREVAHASVKTTEEYDKRRLQLIHSPVHKLNY